MWMILDALESFLKHKPTHTSLLNSYMLHTTVCSALLKYHFQNLPLEILTEIFREKFLKN